MQPRITINFPTKKHKDNTKIIFNQLKRKAGITTWKLFQNMMDTYIEVNKIKL